MKWRSLLLVVVFTAFILAAFAWGCVMAGALGECEGADGPRPPTPTCTVTAIPWRPTPTVTAIPWRPTPTETPLGKTWRVWMPMVMKGWQRWGD